MRKPYYRIIRYVHAIAAITLGVFFISKGSEKFAPLKLRDKHITVANQDAIVEKIIVQQNYEAPFGYDITMNTMRQSGFIKVIGALQVLVGLLIFLPQTRLAGLLILFPIILNIFLMHVFFDNRPHENTETGSYLAVTIVLLLFYIKPISRVLWQPKKLF